MSNHWNDCREMVFGAVRDVLSDEASSCRCHAVRALVRIKADRDETTGSLIALLHDSDPNVRMEAAAALGKMKVAPATEPLLEMVAGDPEGDVRIQAVAALSKIGSREAVEPLVHCMQEDGYPHLDAVDDDMEYGACWEVQSQALNALGEIGDERATGPVVEFLQSDDYEDLQEDGYRVLSQLDSAGANAFLLDRLKFGGRLARRRAAGALAVSPALGGANGEWPPEIVAGLTDALLDEDPGVRIAAAQALGATQNPLVATSLVLLLGDPDAEVRQEVASILGKIRGSEIAVRLHRLLDEPDPRLKSRIVQLIGEIGHPASFEVLYPLLKSQNEELLYQAVRALGKLGRPGAEHSVAAILADDENHSDLRVQAVLSLGRMLTAASSCEPEAREAIPGEQDPSAEEADAVPDPEHILRVAAFDDDEQVALAALSVLVEIDADEAAATLTGLVRGDEDHSNGRLDGVADLAGAADSVEEAESETAARRVLLQATGGKDARSSTLAAILSAGSETHAGETGARDEGTDEYVRPDRSDLADHPVRIRAANLLGTLPEPGRAAVEALIDAAAEGSCRLRREALAALGHIGDQAALPIIGRALDADEMEIRLAALDALGECAASAADVEPAVKLLDDAIGVVRARAVRTLASHQGPRTAEYLIRALKDADMEACRTALELLPEMGLTPPLRKMVLATPFRFSGELRAEAGAVLRRSGDCDSALPLLAALNDPERSEVDWICIDTLAEMFASEATDKCRRENGVG